MTKSKNRNRESQAQLARSPAPQARHSQRPAWRNRIGLIIAFFAITIGGAYLVIFGSETFYQWLSGAPDVKTYRFKQVAKYEHDTTAFTEGLLYHNGKIYESTGLEGKSTLRQIDLKSKQVVTHKLDAKFFGEGLTLWRDQLIQLTYNSGIALCYDLDLKPLDKKFEYEGQGWGLTHDGRHLIMSNGTSELQFRDPETFQLDHRLAVKMGGRRVAALNELEYVDGKIYANIWHDDFILEIDPQNGEVTARIDLRGLIPASQRPNNSEAVLNGIAYNTDSKRFIVTGKYWPYMYEIELVTPDE